MLKRFICRRVMLFMVPCLLLDPALAAVFNPAPVFRTDPLETIVFTRSAVTAPVIHTVHSYATRLKWKLEQYEASKNEGLTAEEIKIREHIRVLVDNRVVPIAVDLDQHNHIERIKGLLLSMSKPLWEGGPDPLGAAFPKAYGGFDLGAVVESIITEELGLGSQSFALIYDVRTALTAAPIEMFGTDEQKRRYLTPLLRGELFGAFAQTEENRGSDVPHLETTFIEKDGGFVINSTARKQYITVGMIADIAIVLARDPTIKPQDHRGISAFIVPLSLPGVEVHHMPTMVGHHGTGTSEISFKHVWIPRENLLGEKNQGFKVSLQTLARGRISITSIILSSLETTVQEVASAYARRLVEGMTALEHQTWNDALDAYMADAKSTRVMLLDAARKSEKGQMDLVSPAMAKLIGGERAVSNAAGAMVLVGPESLRVGSRLERNFRDTRLLTIGEGTTQVMRHAIKKSLSRGRSFETAVQEWGTVLPMSEVATAALNSLLLVTTDVILQERLEQRIVDLLAENLALSLMKDDSEFSGLLHARQWSRLQLLTRRSLMDAETMVARGTLPSELRQTAPRTIVNDDLRLLREQIRRAITDSVKGDSYSWPVLLKAIASMDLLGASAYLDVEEVKELRRMVYGTLAKADVSIAVSTLEQEKAIDALRQFGSAETASTLDDLMKGKTLAAVAWRDGEEPVTAQAEEGSLTSYKLRGRKSMVVNGGVAGAFIVLADVPGHGVSAFLVQKDDSVAIAPGELLGLSGSAIRDIDFRDTPGTLVGGLGDGVAIFQAANDTEADILTSIAAGSGQAVLGMGEKQARDRKIVWSQGGNQAEDRPIIERGQIRELLENSIDRVVAMPFQLAHDAISEAAAVASDMLQIFGGIGYDSTMGVNRFWRDLQALHVLTGGRDVQSQGSWASLAQSLKLGGGQNKIDKLHKTGKLSARERINHLLDPGTPFEEWGLFVAHDRYRNQAPAAGVVTGIGLIHGKPAVVVANDATVKAGAWWPETISKILRAQEMSLRRGLPIVYLVDSSGVNLPYQENIFPGQFGASRIFYYNTLLQERHIPQFSAVMGWCIAGGAYLPALSDSIIMVEGSFMGLAGPNLVKGAIQQDQTKEELGGARMHTGTSRVAHRWAKNDQDALEMIRQEFLHRPAAPHDTITPTIAGIDTLQQNGSVDAVAESVLDAGGFHEIGADQGRAAWTVEGSIGGHPVAVLGIRSAFPDNGSIQKMTDFVRHAQRLRWPVIYVEEGSDHSTPSASDSESHTQAWAGLVRAMTETTTPKVTLLVEDAARFNPEAVMARQGFDPDFTFAWTSHNGKKSLEWASESYVDDILSPVDAHSTIQFSLEALLAHASQPSTDFVTVHPQEPRTIVVPADSMKVTEHFSAEPYLSRLVDSHAERMWIAPEFGNAGGIKAVIAPIEGRLVVIVSEDAAAVTEHPFMKEDSSLWSAHAVEKIVRAQELAIANDLPIVYLMDAQTLPVPYSEEALLGPRLLRRLMLNGVLMSGKLSVPQISVVRGPLHAGSAFLREFSTLVIDGSSGGDTVSAVRAAFREFPQPPPSPVVEAPAKNPDELSTVLPQNHQFPFNLQDITSRLFDAGSGVEEFSGYAPEIMTATAKIGGYPVAIVANRPGLFVQSTGQARQGGVIYKESALKAAGFIRWAEKRGLPLLFLQEVTGFMVGKDAEQGGIIRAGAEMVKAMATTTSPKIVLTLRHASGAGYYAMAAQGFDPDVLLSWPQGRMGVMEGATAVQAAFGTELDRLKKNSLPVPAELAQEVQATLSNYQHTLQSANAADLRFVDGVISPESTREQLILALRMVHQRRAFRTPVALDVLPGARPRTPHLPTFSDEETPAVTLDIYGSRAEIILRKPTLTASFLRQLKSFIRTLRSDPHIGTILIRGNDGKNFCTGADLFERLKMSPADVQDFLSEMNRVFDQLAELSKEKPVIALINGNAFGGGIELALACRYRIVIQPHAVLGGKIEKRTLAFTETRFGILPGAGGTARAARLIGAATAAQIILRARALSAEDALHLKLVDRIVAPENVDKAIETLVAQSPPPSEKAIPAEEDAAQELALRARELQFLNGFVSSPEQAKGYFQYLKDNFGIDSRRYQARGPQMAHFERGGLSDELRLQLLAQSLYPNVSQKKLIPAALVLFQSMRSPDDVRRRAEELGKNADVAPLGLSLAEMVVTEGPHFTLERAQQLERLAYECLLSSPERTQALKYFAATRTPAFHPMPQGMPIAVTEFPGSDADVYTVEERVLAWAASALTFVPHVAQRAAELAVRDVSLIINDTTLRDGFQSHPYFQKSSLHRSRQKAIFFERVADALGSASHRHRLEIAAVVSSVAVPAMSDFAIMADTARLLRSQNKLFPETSYLIFSKDGAKKALDLDPDINELAFNVSASPAYSLANTKNGNPMDFFRTTVVPELEYARQWSTLHADRPRLRLRAYISCVWGYSDEEAVVSIADLSAMILEMHRHGITEIVLSDTTGRATPETVRVRLDQLFNDPAVRDLHDLSFALHMHDSGHGLTNVLTGLLSPRVSVIDTALANLGGSPFATVKDRHTAGNVALEDLVFILDALDIHTGIHFADLLKIVRQLAVATGENLFDTGSRRTFGLHRLRLDQLTDLQGKLRHVLGVSDSKAASSVAVGEILWKPTPEIIANSRLMIFMAKHGITTFAELLHRADTDIEWFWDAAIKDIGISFYQGYTRVVDLSNGKPWATWWIGARMNIVDSALERYHDNASQAKTAIIWEGEPLGDVRQLTYGELGRQVSQLAGGLRKLGVRPGDRIGIYMPMCPEVVTAVLASAKIGAVIIPIFSGYGAEAIATRLQDGGAKILICADGFYRRGQVVPMKETADSAVAKCPSVMDVIVYRRVKRDIPWSNGRDHAWDAVLKDEPIHSSTEELNPEDPLMIIYTSGTTGKPKGTVHVHGGFPIKAAQDMAHSFDIGSNDKVFWYTDIGWMMGPWLIYGALILHSTMVLYEGTPDYPAPDRLWQIVQDHKVTVLGVSPTLVRSLMTKGDEPPARHDLSSLRILGSTGELWNADSFSWLFKQIGRSRIPIINYSGGTEISGGILGGNVITPLRSASFAGPVPGMAVDVVNAEGRSVRGEVGELIIRNPWPGMTRGFWGDPERYLETYWNRFKDVWVHGDWAIRAEDGLWYILGRSDDTIKIAGKRVGPAEVESILVGHPAVAEAAAIGVPDALKGEALVCFVVLKPGRPASESLSTELQDLLAASLGKPLRPKFIHFVSELPKTRNGKMLRRIVKLIYTAQDPGDISSLENPAALTAIAAVRAEAFSATGDALNGGRIQRAA